MKLTLNLVIGICLAFGLGFSSSSWAREWYFQPNASIQSFYDTNIRMVSDEDVSKLNGKSRDAFGFVSYGNANFGVRQDNYDVNVSATGVIKRYISDLDLNNDNVYVNLKSFYKLTERQTLALNGQFADVTILGSVIDTSAFAQQNTQRTTLLINPEWSYAISELTSLQVDYTHANTSYGDTGAQEQKFNNNTFDFGVIDLSHQWLPSLKSHAIFEAMLFDTPSTDQTTTNYNSKINFDYNISETWTASLGGGFRVTDTETVNNSGLTVREHSAGPLFSFKTQKILDTGKIDAGYYRETATRGSGGFSLTDVSYMGYTHKLGDRFEIALRASYNDIRSIISTNNQNFTFYSTGVRASWLISPQLDLTASHQFRFRESQIIGANNANSNAFFLMLNYKWDPFTTREF